MGYITCLECWHSTGHAPGEETKPGMYYCTDKHKYVRRDYTCPDATSMYRDADMNKKTEYLRRS